MAIPVAIYTRLSFDDSGTQTATARQEKACRQYADLRGWQVARVFEDVDRSAYKKGVRRPAYEDMLAAIDRGEIAGVLVWKLDRLARRPAEFERFWSRCEEHAVMLASVTEPIDSSSELGLALVRILVTFAALETATMTLRTRAKARELAEAGVAPLRRTYGWTNRREELVPYEADRLREAAQRVLAGESVSSIARDWRARGVRGAQGGAWTASSLRRSLAAPALVGDRAYAGEVVAHDCWPPILDRVTAREVARLVEGGIRARTAMQRRRCLSGLITCGVCGRMMVVRASREDRFYKCPGTHQACGRVRVRAELVERCVIPQALARITSGAARAGPRGSGDIADLLRREAAALDRIARDYYVLQTMSRSEYLSLRAEVQQHFDARRTGADPTRRAVLNALLENAHPMSVWEQMSPDEQRDALTFVLERVTVMPTSSKFVSRRLLIDWCNDTQVRLTRPSRTQYTTHAMTS